MAGFSLGEAIVGVGVDLSDLRKGFAAAESESGGAVGRIGGVVKAGLGWAAGAVVAGIGLAVTAIVGLGTAAFAAGQELDAAFDSIVIKTGETGKELDGMKESLL